MQSDLTVIHYSLGFVMQHIETKQVKVPTLSFNLKVSHPYPVIWGVIVALFIHSPLCRVHVCACLRGLLDRFLVFGKYSTCLVGLGSSDLSTSNGKIQLFGSQSSWFALTASLLKACSTFCL